MRSLPVLVLVLALFANHPLPAEAAEDNNACPRWITKDDKLKQAVRQGLATGELVVVLRHTTTDGPRTDRTCLEEDRTLGPIGQGEAREIADALKTLQIAQSEVRHSEMCRAIDTAKLVFGSTYSASSESNLNSGCCSDWLVKQLSSPRNGSNLFLVTHSGNLNSISIGDKSLLNVPSDKEFGIAAVFSPRLGVEKGFIGCLRPSEWKDLAVQPKGGGEAGAQSQPRLCVVVVDVWRFGEVSSRSGGGIRVSGYRGFLRNDWIDAKVPADSADACRDYCTRRWRQTRPNYWDKNHICREGGRE